MDDARRIKKLEAQVEAYQKAFNKIDDHIEYGEFKLEHFAGIAVGLTQTLKKIEDNG